jgi:lantibiotic modifying enzyme
MTPEKAVEAAFSIATDIGANAIWDGNRCNWLSQTSDIFLGARLPAAGMCSPNLYDGTAGTAMFMAECYRATSDPIVKKYAEGAIAHALSRIDDLPPRFALGVYTGHIGVAVAAIRVGKLLDREDLIKAGRDIVIDQLNADLTDLCIMDVMVGLGGAIPAVLSLSEHLPEDQTLDVLTRWGDVLLKNATHSDRGTSWDTMAEMQSGLDSIGIASPKLLESQCCKPNLLGYAHGTSGIALALMELGTQTDENRFMRCAEDAVAYETNWYDVERDVWPDLRHGETPKTNSGTNVAWCHGAAGIGLSRVRMWELTQHDVYKIDAENACSQTAAMIAQQLKGETNWSLCHGILGNLELLITSQSIGLENRDGLIEQALDYGHEQFIEKRRPWVYDTATSEPLPGLMLGTAGTGYAYLRYASPASVQSILLINPEKKPINSPMKRSGEFALMNADLAL